MPKKFLEAGKIVGTHGTILLSGNVNVAEGRTKKRL